MSGFLLIFTRRDQIKGGLKKYGMVNPCSNQPAQWSPIFTDYLVFEGISVDDFSGQAVITWTCNCLYPQGVPSMPLKNISRSLGYTGEQAYLTLVELCAVEGRIQAELLIFPMPACTLALQRPFFDQDILPH